MIKLSTVGYSNKIGGAGRALYRWENLLQTSSEVSLFPVHFDDHNPFGKKIYKTLDSISSKSITKFESYVGRKLGYTDNGAISLNIVPTFFGLDLRKLQVDFINLHWINNEMISISQANKLEQKLIWTLHDPWLMNGLGNYPQDKNNMLKLEKYLDRWQLNRKRSLITNESKFISPTNWISNLFMERGVQKENIEVIPNPIPFETYHPVDVANFKKSLDISDNSICVLLASDSNLHDKRKGIMQALVVLEILSKYVDFTVLSFGNMKLRNPNFRCIDFGYIRDNVEQNRIYNIADFTFLSSTIDNLPQIMTESLAAGTPVFSLPHGDAQKILNRGMGFCASTQNLEVVSSELYNFISKLDSIQRQKISKLARKEWNNEELLLKFLEFIKK
jgi:glycosyltransferase involved in cell wall biosynthesis